MIIVSIALLIIGMIIFYRVLCTLGNWTGIIEAEDHHDDPWLLVKVVVVVVLFFASWKLNRI